MKVFAYLRVSTRNQLDGFGFDRQEETIKNFADSRGFEIVRVFKEEAVSGTTDMEERPAFQSMIAEVLKNGVNTIIVESLDRLAREYRVQETLLVYLASKGITLFNARTGEDVTEAIKADPMKRALVQIQGVFAELEKNILVRRLKAGRERAREEKGKCGGRQGYQETEEGKAILQAIKAFRRKLKGQGRPSYEKVAQRLNESGMKTMDGREFTRANVHKLVSKYLPHLAK